MSVNNALASRPRVAPITLASPYSFQMTGGGGIPPYTWTTTFGALPTSITIDSSRPNLRHDQRWGLWNSIRDIPGNGLNLCFSHRSLPVTVGVVSGMIIDPSGVGTINRGSNYLGTLAVNGTYTTPVSWSVTADSPNSLPTGLTLTASPANNGQTARITGLYTGVAFTGYMVKVQAVDIAGHLATTVLSLTAANNLAITTNSPLPTATVGVTIPPIQFTATGGGSPTGGAPSYIWSIPSPPIGFPFNLSSGGLLTGTAGVVNTWTFTVSLSDGMSPADNVTKNLHHLILDQHPGYLHFFAAAARHSGVAYNQTLVATGGTAPYTWAIVGGGLPAGSDLSILPREPSPATTTSVETPISRSRSRTMWHAGAESLHASTSSRVYRSSPASTTPTALASRYWATSQPSTTWRPSRVPMTLFCNRHRRHRHCASSTYRQCASGILRRRAVDCQAASPSSSSAAPLVPAP